MKHQRTLSQRSTPFETASVGGVKVRITCEPPPLNVLPDRSYLPFLTAVAGNASDDDLVVHLTLGPCPVCQTATPLFESDRSWWMLRDSDEYFLRAKGVELRHRGDWIARFRRPTSRVLLHCNPELVSEADGVRTLLCPFRYPLDQLLLMYHLAERGGVLTHAAGGAIHGVGMIFPGRSGAGKSTISRQLVGVPGVQLLSDDRMIVRKMEGGFRAFGTPWPGDAKIAVNDSAPLRAICFLAHGAEHKLAEITPAKAMELLMPVTSLPWFDKDVLPSALATCEELVSTVAAFQLYFKPDPGVAPILEELAARLC